MGDAERPKAGRVTEDSPTLRPGRGRWMIPLVVLLAAMAVYANTLTAGFTWDDEWLILDNPRIADPTYPKYMLFEKRWWRPVKRISLMLDYHIFGPRKPWGFHATNMALEGFVCLALYFFVLRLAQDRRLAAFVALLFAFHPVHVEAVANISHRKESLALLFYLLAFLAYLRARSDQPIGGLVKVFAWLTGRRGDRALFTAARVELLFYTAVCFLAGLLSKEVGAIMLPVTVVVHALLFEEGSLRQRAQRLWPYMLPFVAVLIVYGAQGYLIALHDRLTSEQISWITESKTSSYASVLLIAFKAFGASIGFMIWPWPLYLDRAFEMPDGLADLGVLAGLILFGAFLAALVLTLRVGLGVTRLSRSWRLVLFGACFCGLNLIPVVNFIPLTHWLVAERFVYVPSLGFVLMVGVGLKALFDRGTEGSAPAYARPAALVFGVLLLLVFGALTVKQNKIWDNSESLWEHTLKYNDRSYRAQYGYGLELDNDGLDEEAELYYLESIDIHPSYPEPQYALALMLLNNGRYDESIEWAEKYARLKRRDPEPFIVIGNALFFQKDYKGASSAYSRAVERKPRHLNGLYNWANTLIATGRYEEALPVLERGLKEKAADGLTDDDADMMYMKGNALERSKRLKDAADVYHTVVRLNPRRVDALNGLGRIYARQGRCRDAIRVLKQSLKHKPEQQRTTRTLRYAETKCVEAGQ